MSLIGYARVSSAEGRQVLDRQLDALNAAGCERVFEDHASGAAPERPNLTACLNYLPSGDVLVVLSRLITVYGAPGYLRSDNGPEFVSRAILKWLATTNIDTAHIDPSKPWQNATNESFNDKFRDECLSLEWFRSREEARVLFESWRRHYNEVHPHSSLRYLTPREFINQSTDKSDGAVLQ